MSIYLHWLLPNSPWVLAAIGQGPNGRKTVRTFLPTEEGHRDADNFIAMHPGDEIRVLAGRARTILSSVPTIDHVADVCAVGIRLPLAQKASIQGLQNAPAILFEYRGELISAWRFEKPIAPRDADKSERFLAERFNGKRLNFFIPVPVGVSVDSFDRRCIDPKNIEAEFKAGPRPVRHDDPEVRRQAESLMETLSDYGFEGVIKGIRCGPVITLYEIELKRGTLASNIAARSEDIARDMGSRSARVITNLGPRTIGIELPNEKREKVIFRHLLACDAFQKSKAALRLMLGRTANGEPLVADLAAMPHLLLAGTTGAGKSVGLNTMILSLLYSLPPDQLKLVIIDPKEVELAIYRDIPHLFCNIVTDAKRAVATLKGVIAEMADRYRLLAQSDAENITTYNATAGKKLPYIVVVIDEVADLIMEDAKDGKEIEACIQRLAQKARAAGIHLIVATQRPSVDAVKGTIKANLATRVSYRMAQAVDSRTILGESGAEQLLGEGDMLFQHSGGKLVRAHGPFVDRQEIKDAVKKFRALGKPDYRDFAAEEDDLTFKIAANRSTGQAVRKYSETTLKYVSALKDIFTPGGHPIKGVEVRRALTSRGLTWGRPVYDAAVDALGIDIGDRNGITESKPWTPPSQWPKAFS